MEEASFPGDEEHRIICGITAALDLASKSSKKTEQHRLEAGRLLIEARQYVPSTKWQAWCKKWVKRSLGDIRKLMKMASSNDPEAALAAERDETRVRVNRKRAVRAFLTVFSELDLDQKRAVVAQLQKEISDAEASAAEEPQDLPATRGSRRSVLRDAKEVRHLAGA